MAKQWILPKLMQAVDQKPGYNLEWPYLKSVCWVTVGPSSLAAKQVVTFIERTDSFLEAGTYRLTVWLLRWWPHPLYPASSCSGLQSLQITIGAYLQRFRNAAVIVVGHDKGCYAQLDQNYQQPNRLEKVLKYIYGP